MQKRIVLEDFQGSLELLLQLVRRSEIPVEQLTLQEIIGQLIAAVEEEDPSIEEHTESLAPAATLLLLKSRCLLPIEGDEDQEDVVAGSPEELMRHVVDYCHFRQAAETLTKREKEQAGRYRRQAEETFPRPPKGTGVQHIELTDLVTIVQRALKRATKRELTVIEEEQWRVADAIDHLRQELGAHTRIAFEHYFNPQRARGEMIVLFLAILEMMKMHELRVDKGELVAV